MKYGTITILFCSVFIIACSPYYRFTRLVEKHPYLLDSVQQTKIIVRDSVHQDTQIVWNTKVDTLILNQVKIERRNDTFRIITRERPCTTYVQETIIKPSKIIERYIKEKEKGQIWKILKIKWYYIIILLLLIYAIIRR